MTDVPQQSAELHANYPVANPIPDRIIESMKTLRVPKHQLTKVILATDDTAIALRELLKTVERAAEEGESASELRYDVRDAMDSFNKTHTAVNEMTESLIDNNKLPRG